MRPKVLRLAVVCGILITLLSIRRLTPYDSVSIETSRGDSDCDLVERHAGTRIRNVMRKFFSVLAIGFGLLLGHILPTSAQVPDGVIELSGGSVAAGIGFSWGGGTLIFQGKRYPLKISGFTLASVGITDYTAAGNVTGLRTAQDINGIFTSVAAGATLGGGGNIAAMRNQNGVVIQMTSTTAGLSLTVAAEGVKITIAN